MNLFIWIVYELYNYLINQFISQEVSCAQYQFFSIYCIKYFKNKANIEQKIIIIK